ncbi:MAG: type II toxin-antitoxin system RelE/ParE family toxin [Verrucomicrobiaceae bacterium]
MSAEPVILPEADQDIADAYQWLERRDPGLGKEFLRCLSAAFEVIGRTPQAFSRSLEDFRHYNLRRFPHTIYYDDTGSGVVVYAVFHSAQNPARLRRKLWLRRPPQ